MKNFRIFENNELFWQGKARDPEHAEEKAFWDDQPGGLCRYTLQEYRKIQLSKSIRGMGWFTHYANAPIYLY